MMEKIGRIKGKEGVSEIIGTVLLLAIAVIIFSSLIVYVLSMDTSPSAPSVHMVGSMDDNAIATVENRGGDSIPIEDIRVVVKKGDNQSHTLEGSALSAVFHDANDNGRWDVGDYIELDCTSMFGEVARWRISVAIIDRPSNSIIMSGVLQQGILHTMPPVARFSYNPYDPKTQETLYFNATESYDPDGGSIVEYRWDWTSDGVVDAYGPTPVHTYASEGTYNVTLTIVDDEGETNTTSTAHSHGINVPPPIPVSGNVPPDSNFSWSVNPNVNGTIDFTSNVSDPDGEIVSYEWNFGDGTSSTSQNPSHTYDTSGTYTVTLIVTDDNGETSTREINVEVPNIRPQAGFSTSSANITTASSVTFDGGSPYSYDKDGNIVNWSWDFGDGDTAYGSTVSHQYNTPGNYTVTLNVTDNSGGWAVEQKNVTVSSPATASSPRFLFVDNTPTGWESGIDNLKDACQNIMPDSDYSYGKAIDQWVFTDDADTSPDLRGANISETVLNQFDIVIWSTGNFPGDGSDANYYPYNTNSNYWSTPMTEGSDDVSDHMREIEQHMEGNHTAGVFMMSGTYAVRDLVNYPGNGAAPSEVDLGTTLGLYYDNDDQGGIVYDSDWVSYSDRLSDDYFRGKPYSASGSMVGTLGTSSGGAYLNFSSPIELYGLNKQSSSLFNYSLQADSLSGGSGEETQIFYENFYNQAGWTHGGTGDEWEYEEWDYDWAPPYRESWMAGTDILYSGSETGWYSNDANCYSLSPTIDLSGYSSATLEFIDWYEFGDAYDHVTLEVYDGSWHELDTFDQGNDPDAWTTRTYDLSSYVGGTIQLRWTLISDSHDRYYGYYFDSVEITGITSDSVTGNFAIDATRDQNRSIILGFDLNADEITEESRTNYLRNVLAWMAEGAGYNTEVWVNNDPPAGWLDDETHLDTIQAGIDAVPPGGTVNVIGSSGQIYNEQLVIDKSVTLIGIDTPTIRASSGSILTLRADWTTVKDIDIEGNAAQNGIYLDGAARCSIINCTLATNIADKCISLENAHNNTIRGCTLKNATYGIHGRYSLGTKIRENSIQSTGQMGISLYRSSLASITNNTIRLTDDAVYMENLESCTVSYNTITDNTGTAIELVSATDQNTLRYNTIQNNTRGIYLNISNSNIVTDNVISDHSGSALLVSDYSHSNTIEDNTLQSNLNGVELQDSSNNDIVHNQIEGNQYGITGSSSSNNVIQANQVMNHTETGISLSASSNFNTIYNNTVHNNSRGLYIYDSKNNTVERCTISNSTTDGVYLNRALYNLPGGNVVIYNVITGNGRHGIYMQSSNENEITQNDIYGNGQSGIRLYSFSNTNAVYNNTLWENFYGIYVEGSSYNNVTGNTINNSSVSGIYLNNYAQENTIVDNLVEYTGNGMKVQSSSTNNITGNVIRWNQGFGILSTSSSNNRLASNYLHNNTQTGLLITSGDSNDVLSNTVEHNDIGIHLSSSGGSGNIIVDNIVHSSASHGIYLENSKPATAGNNEIRNNTVHDNGGTGVILATSKGNSVEDNTVYGNQRGIYLSSSNGNSIFDNTVYGNTDGIYLSASNSNSVGDNAEGGNRIYSNSVTGIYLGSSSDNNVVNNNTLWQNAPGIVINNSDTADVKNNHLYWHNTSAAIQVLSSTLGSSRPIQTNTICNNSIGIEIRSSNGTHVENGNTISYNERGVYIENSGSCTITGNTMSSNTNESIYVYSSTYCTIAGNTISGSTRGIYLNQSTDGTIQDNTLSYNSRGAYLTSSTSNNVLKENTFTIDLSTSYGIYVVGSNSKNNKIYSNNFENTSFRSSSLCYDEGGGNSWYNPDSEEKEGNYWKNYEQRYPNATQQPATGTAWYWSVYYDIAGPSSEEDIRPLVSRVE